MNRALLFATPRRRSAPAQESPLRQRRLLRKRSSRPWKRKNRRALTCSTSRRRAARSPIATARRWRKIKLSYNLTIDFPTPLDFSDAQALDFAREKIRAAEKRLGRSLEIPDAAILRHYHNRGFLPFEIAQNLNEAERAN